jgi:hypothetical protein
MRGSAWLTAAALAASAGPAAAQTPDTTAATVGQGTATTTLPPTMTPPTGTSAVSPGRSPPSRPQVDGTTSPITALIAEGGTATDNGLLVTWRLHRMCPVAGVEALIASRFSRGEAGAGLTADLQTTKLGGGWRLDLSMQGPGGTHERTFVSGQCARLLNEAVDEIELVAKTGQLSGETTQVPTLPAATGARGQDVRSRWALLDVTAGAGLGLVRPVMALLRLAIGYRGPKWSVAATATFLLPRDVLSGMEPPITVNMWLGAAGLRGCWIPKLGRVELGACATLQAGAVRGRRVDGDGERHTLAWVGASLGPAMSIRLVKTLRLRFGFELTLVARRPIFSFAGKQDVCCEQRVGGAALAGLELLLP